MLLLEIADKSKILQILCYKYLHWEPWSTSAFTLTSFSLDRFSKTILLVRNKIEAKFEKQFVKVSPASFLLLWSVVWLLAFLCLLSFCLFTNCWIMKVFTIKKCPFWRVTAYARLLKMQNGRPFSFKKFFLVLGSLKQTLGRPMTMTTEHALLTNPGCDAVNLYAKMTLYMETFHNYLNHAYHFQLSLVYMLLEFQVPGWPIQGSLLDPKSLCISSYCQFYFLRELFQS